MIFYKNIRKRKQSLEKDLTFSIFDAGVVSNKDDLILKNNECKNFYNLSVSNGALENGLGFEQLSLPASAGSSQEHVIDFSQKVDDIKYMLTDRWYDSNTGEFSYNIMMTDSQNILWGIGLIDEYDGFVWKYSTRVPGAPIGSCNYRVNNVDSTIIFTENGMIYMSADLSGVYANFPPLISCLVHYDKFFGITNKNRNELVYTSNLDLTEWSSQNEKTIEFLDNRGSFKKLVAFNDYVYLFREFGITKISIYTSKNDFSFTHLYVSPSKIFEKSVCVCGDKILFVTRDGLYSFNGNSVDKICPQFDVYFKNLDNVNCTAECFNGKYYLATNCSFPDNENVGCESVEHVNNVLFELDVENFNLNILRGVDIRQLLKLENEFMNKLCASFNFSNKQKVGQLTNSGKLFDVALEKEWSSFYSDLGYFGKRKKIKKLTLETKFDCDVEILSNIGSKTIHFDGKNGIQSKNLSLCGDKFQFKFKTSNQNIKICKPMINFDVV